MKLLLIVFLLLTIVNLAFAEIPIYCPHEKILLYNYQKEIKPNEVMKAEDFKPANDLISQPKENTPMVCPICGSPLNGYEWWNWEKKMKPPVFVFNGLTMLTKDKDGNFKFVPYDFQPEDWEGK